MLISSNSYLYTILPFGLEFISDVPNQKTIHGNSTITASHRFKVHDVSDPAQLIPRYMYQFDDNIGAYMKLNRTYRKDHARLSTMLHMTVVM